MVWVLSAIICQILCTCETDWPSARWATAVAHPIPVAPCCQAQQGRELLWLLVSLFDSCLGERVGKRGENTIKMSCISTDQSLPNSHVLRLTWLSDKWRLEEKRWWKWHWSHKENSAFILLGFFCVMSDCSVSWHSNTHNAIFVLTLVVWSRLAATI